MEVWSLPGSDVEELRIESAQKPRPMSNRFAVWHRSIYVCDQAIATIRFVVRP